MDDQSKIIDGRKLAERHERFLKKKIEKLPKTPWIVSILIGDDPPSVLYSNLKRKKAESLGIKFEIVKFSANSVFSKVAGYMQTLNRPDGPDGVMVQLPLPKEFLKTQKMEDLLKIINPQKDVDGLTLKGAVLPAAVKAVLSILEDEKIVAKGKRIAVLGRSNLIGKPLAEELKKRGAKILVGHSQTPDLKKITLKADIIVSTVGKEGLVSADMVSNGAFIIDVGTSKNKQGKIVGDVDFNSVFPKVSKITPVPGGVGPVTVISLMENVVQLVEGKSYGNV